MRRSKFGNETGAALVEFSLVLLAFLVILVGTLSYGIAFVTHQAVSYAAGAGAEAAYVVDPEATVKLRELGDRALPLANARLASVLGFFPGGAPVLTEVRTNCAARNADVSTSYLCVSASSRTGRRVVTVQLAPRFQSLWPGFPETGLIPTPEFVRATGTAVVAASSADDGAG